MTPAVEVDAVGISKKRHGTNLRSSVGSPGGWLDKWAHLIHCTEVCANHIRTSWWSCLPLPLKQTSVLPLCLFAELPSSEHLSVADATWLALNVVSGGGGFSGSQPIGVTKIAKSVIAPLADQNISVFMLSTYQTDFILVRGHEKTRRSHLPTAECSVGQF